MASARTPAGTAGDPAQEAGLGLRERKKIRTRQAIRRAAYRLFVEQGYDATPVDQIAAAADVSPSTVFRYFPTKEDIVLTDEYDPVMVERLRTRPKDEPPVTSLRHVLVDLLHQVVGEELDDMAIRVELVREVPALRARMSESMSASGRLLGAALAERSGRDPDDFEVRVVVGAVLGALNEALMHCMDHGRFDRVGEDIDRALDVLARGLSL